MALTVVNLIDLFQTCADDLIHEWIGRQDQCAAHRLLKTSLGSTSIPMLCIRLGL